MIECTFLGNCAVYLQCGGKGLLVDCPNSLQTLFNGVPSSETEKMRLAQTPYERLCGFAFSHRHNDHYDRKRLREILERRPELTAFVPNGETPEQGSLVIGDFTLNYYRIAHSGEEFARTIHRVLVVTFGEKSFYFSGDADWTSPLHLQILERYKPAAAFYNPNFLIHPEALPLLKYAEKNFICHMPVGIEDKLGIAKKCLHVWDAFAEKPENTVLVTQYPSSFTIA